MITSIKPFANALRSGWVGAGTACLLAGTMAACGGGGSDSVTSAVAPAATTATAGTTVKSVEKNDPIAFSENIATMKSAESKCRKQTHIHNGEASVRKASRERMRAVRCTERWEDGEPENGKVG